MKKKLAVDKYYKDKITRLQQDNNSLLRANSTYLAENRKLQKENNKLQEENQQQREWIERLLEYTELNQKDIKSVCEKDKRLGQMLGMFERLGMYRMLG